MKKHVVWLAALLLWGSAQAQESASRELAFSALTEVYGYTSEEAQRFQYTEENGTLVFFDPAHENWRYTLPVDGDAGDLRTPFAPREPDAYVAYPGEGTTREGVRSLKESWFPVWESRGRADMLEWAVQNELTLSSALLEGLATGRISAGNALHELLVSCYGEPFTWTVPLREWEQETMQELGLALEADWRSEPGIVRFTLPREEYEGEKQVIRFVGEPPEEWKSLAADKKELEAWTPLCGVLVRIRNENPAWEIWNGYAAYARGNERILVGVGSNAEKKDLWTSQKLLYPERDFFLTVSRNGREFEVVYPAEGGESELFRFQNSNSNAVLKEYVRVNQATGEGIRIRSMAGARYDVCASGPDGYVHEEIQQAHPIWLTRVEISGFPTTLEACRKEKEENGALVPEGYAVISGVHLREKKSSRSRDLGLYEAGVMVRVLGVEPGNPSPWYHVRVGSVEGYMSGNYVVADPENANLNPLTYNRPLEILEAREGCQLKEDTDWFAKTVMEVPAGTRMHVMGRRGKWLHVMIPQGEIDWIMDVNGMDGYVKADQVQSVQLK